LGGWAETWDGSGDLYFRGVPIPICDRPEDFCTLFGHGQELLFLSETSEATLEQVGTYKYAPNFPQL
jgi:hypothetical protein